MMLALFSALALACSVPSTANPNAVQPVPMESSALACQVDVSSTRSIESYLSKGVRTEENGGSTLTYKTLYQWNTVGVEIRFDNGNVVSGINVRISPGYSRATISMDFPEINGSGRYYLSSDGILRSADGSFTYRCR